LSERSILARETPANAINGNSIGSKSLCGEFSHVRVAGNIRPVLGEDATGELFDFAEGDGFEAARSFEAKAESSYAAE
jgi:hypothetical protein